MTEDQKQKKEIPTWLKSGGGALLAILLVAFGWWLSNDSPRLTYHPIESYEALQLGEDMYYVTEFFVKNAGRAPLTGVRVQVRFTDNVVEVPRPKIDMDKMIDRRAAQFFFDLPIRDKRLWRVTSLGPVVDGSVAVRCDQIMGREVDPANRTLTTINIAAAILSVVLFVFTITIALLIRRNVKIATITGKSVSLLTFRRPRFDR